jgi:hypothetical protein
MMEDLRGDGKMPVHDWSLVDAGTFHALHTAWVTHLSEALNGGILPAGFYAMPEQHGNRLIGDVLTLQSPGSAPPISQGGGGVAVAEVPPSVGRKLSPQSAYRAMRRTVVIRHVSGHRVVALLEIVSPSNKDRPAHVAEFSEKVVRALWQNVSVMVVDIHVPGVHDQAGMHGDIWLSFDDEPYELPGGLPYTVASYVAPPPPATYIEHFAVGSLLPEMPLFLNPDRYVNIPLELTYMMAWQGMPGFWREILEGGRS